MYHRCNVIASSLQRIKKRTKKRDEHEIRLGKDFLPYFIPDKNYSLQNHLIPPIVPPTCGKRFFNLRQMIFHSQSNDFSIS